MTTFSESLVEAHSSVETEAELIRIILNLIQVWDHIDTSHKPSLRESQQEAPYTVTAQSLVATLKSPLWGLSGDEIAELSDHADEFRRIFDPPESEAHQPTGTDH